MRPNEKEYAERLEEIQDLVRQGKDCNILGMNIPTDNSISHLGIPKKIHHDPFFIDFEYNGLKVYMEREEWEKVKPR